MTSRRRARDQSARIGEEVKVARATLAMSAHQAALRAGVSWSTFARVELGDPGVGIGTLCAVAEAVGLDIVLRAYPGRPPSLRDTGQLEIAEWLCSGADPAWHSAVEVLVGERGESIDLVLFGPQEIVAVEIERMASDFQAQYRRAQGKRELLAGRHRRPVRLVLAVEDTTRNRRAVAMHQALLSTVLPGSSREVWRAMRGGTPLDRDGLIWVRRRLLRARDIERMAPDRRVALGSGEISSAREQEPRTRAPVVPARTR